MYISLRMVIYVVILTCQAKFIAVLRFQYFLVLQICCLRSLTVVHWTATANQLTAALIDGKTIAEEIRSEIADEVRRMKSSIGKTPGLAVILVGDRRDCQIYVRNKILACEEAGIRSEVEELPESCSEDEILSALKTFNENPEIHGVLVQLPLPEVRPETVP